MLTPTTPTIGSPIMSPRPTSAAIHHCFGLAADGRAGLEPAGDEGEQQRPEHCRGDRHREPPEDQQPDTERAEDPGDVDVLDVAAHTSALRDQGVLGGHHVAADRGTGADHSPATEHDHVAGDAARDPGVTPHHEHVTVDRAAVGTDHEVAPHDERVAVDGSLDRRPPVDRDDRSVDRLAGRNGDVTDGDPAVAVTRDRGG